MRAYYASFDEWGRLDAPEGATELRRACEVLDQYLAPGSRVLDLGGGPGRYAIELARRGHRVALADLSPELLDAARARIAESGLSACIESIEQVNAVDLGRYPDCTFDAVLAFGPFYHLLSEDERGRAAREVARVLRAGGLAFVVYIPRVSGIVGLLQRAAGRPGQVTAEVLREAAATGVFRNVGETGFQEGYYPRPGEIEALLQLSGFALLDAVSLKSIAHGLAGEVAALAEPLRAEVERLAQSVSREPEVVAMCGHVLLVARRAG